MKKFDSIDSVLADIRKGKMVIVVDDADRENEGDLVMAGQFVTPAAINLSFMSSPCAVRHNPAFQRRLRHEAAHPR